MQQEEFIWESTSVYRQIVDLLFRQRLEEVCIEFIVQNCFPDLLASLKEQMVKVHSLQKIQKISLIVCTADSEAEAKRTLFLLYKAWGWEL